MACRSEPSAPRRCAIAVRSDLVREDREKLRPSVMMARRGRSPVAQRVRRRAARRSGVVDMHLPDKWLAGALERAAKTIAQTLATGLLALNIATLTTFTPIRNALVVAVSAGVLSVITSFGSIRLSEGQSFVKNTLLRSA